MEETRNLKKIKCEKRAVRKNNSAENLKERDHLADINVDKFVMVFLTLATRISI
jgi:hypothetical protein